MNKKAKKILITALSLTSLSSVIAIPLAVVNLNNKSNFSSSNVSTFNDGLISANQVDKQKTYRYFLDNNLKGKSYLSYDEAFNAYIREYDPIKYNLYMGNPYEAISNSNDNSIDINKLRKYDKDIYSKLQPAYINAYGTLERDFESARDSYGNAGGIEYWYTDFNGNLFEDKQDAVNSIKTSINPTPVMYYNLPGNKKFNPLNTNDLLLFKKDIYDTILKYFEHSTEINFPYGINIYEYSPTKNTYSSLNSNLYTKDNMIQGIIDEVIVAMYRATLKYLKEKGKYDVALIFQTCFDKNNSQKVGWDKNGHLKCWWYVDKKNIKNPNNIKYNVDSNRKNSRYSTPYIEFEELDAKDVDSFKIFFDPGWASDNGKTDNNKNKEFVKWCDKNNITHSYYAWRANDMARTFTINNFMGKDFSFKVDFDFDGKSNSDRGTGIGPKNLDQKILSLGADNLGLRFDLDVKLNPNFKYDDTILGDYIQKEINGLSATSSFFQIVRNKVSEIIKPKFTKNIVKFSDFILKFVYDKFDYNKEVKDSRYNNPSNFYNKMFTIEPGANIVDNRLIFEDRVSNEYFKKGTAEKHSQSELHNIQVEYDNLLQKQDASSINNTNPSNLKNTELSVLLKQDNNLRFVIEYNKNPLFVLEQPIIFPDGNWRSTFKDLGKSNFKANSGISVDDWVSKFTNVSNKFSKEKVNPNSTENNYYNLIDMNKSTNNIVQKEVEYIKGKKINGWEFNYDTNNAIYYKTNSRPTLSNSLGLDSYKINSIIEVYNNLINQYSATKNLNKPEDVVYLYDLYDGQRLSPVDLSYREFLSNGSNQSLSLYSGNAVNLYSDRLTLSLAIDKTQTTSPATVVILRDSRGRIVNPGVTVTKDEQTLITSDAVFDSKQTILQNFYRQKVIPKSENIVYYDDGGKYTPLENKVNQIYFLNIKENVVDNSQDQTSNKEVTKTIYFLSYKDCWNYLNDYLSKNVIKALLVIEQ